MASAQRLGVFLSPGLKGSSPIFLRREVKRECMRECSIRGFLILEHGSRLSACGQRLFYFHLRSAHGFPRSFDCVM